MKLKYQCKCGHHWYTNWAETYSSNQPDECPKCNMLQPPYFNKKDYADAGINEVWAISPTGCIAIHVADAGVLANVISTIRNNIRSQGAIYIDGEDLVFTGLHPTKENDE